MDNVPVISLVFLAGSAVLLAAGAIFLATTRAFVANAARAEAVVVVTENSPKSADGAPSPIKAKFWVAEFIDRKGLRQRLQLGMSMDFSVGPLQLGEKADKSLPPAGSKIVVFFDPRNPRRVKRDTFRDLWMLPVVCVSASMLSLALAALLWMFGA